jgi:hypothetical protein
MHAMTEHIFWLAFLATMLSFSLTVALIGWVLG